METTTVLTGISKKDVIQKLRKFSRKATILEQSEICKESENCYRMTIYFSYNEVRK